MDSNVTPFRPYSTTHPAPAGYYFRRRNDEQVRDLLDARDILCTAMFDAIEEKSSEGFDMAWRAVRYLDSVATTAVSAAIASRFTIPIGS